MQAYREKRARGEVIIVRYADDFIVGFQDQSEASEFRKLLSERMEGFHLTLHPEKTQLIRFGRFAVQQCERMRVRKPRTFTFLGFTHICSRTRNGNFAVKRRTDKKRMRKKLREIKETLMINRHAPVTRQGKWLKRVLKGYFNYHAVPWNMKTLNAFRSCVCRDWLRALRRRSQRHRMPWCKFAKLVKLFIPEVRRAHDHPRTRFDAKHSR